MVQYCYDGYGREYDCSNGLSYGARIGIGIGIAVLVLAVVLLISYLRRRKLRQQFAKFRPPALPFANNNNNQENPSNPYANNPPPPQTEPYYVNQNQNQNQNMGQNANWGNNQYGNNTPAPAKTYQPSMAGQYTGSRNDVNNGGGQGQGEQEQGYEWEQAREEERLARNQGLSPPGYDLSARPNQEDSSAYVPPPGQPPMSKRAMSGTFIDIHDMYQSAYTTTPPDPYRSSPIAVSARQPYSGAFSPPPSAPIGNGFAPARSGQSNYNQYPSAQQNTRTPPNRYVPSSYAQQHQQLAPARHKGTLAPGKIVRVGESSVRIERYLSEGGYAHVYLTSSEKPIYPAKQGDQQGSKGYTEHCLKRIAFQDEAVWTDVEKEIAKALPPNDHLTQYLGSAHNRLPNGGYEVFILMEFCAGGGIIDLLNKRLRDRLKEIEILNMFTDVCEAVAAMHALSQPLLHRDLKIENVLSQPTALPPSPERPSALIFKLCDFGSTTFPALRPPSSKLEVDSLSLDLNKHTTLQYRSPEMVEPMLGWAVGLPSDVWALGVLLYKLCYYTTPFEEHGTLAIVNAKYTFPQYPVYSPRLQHLVAAMLVEQPLRRPTVFEVLKTAHQMSGTRPEVAYPSPSRSIPAYAKTGRPDPPKPSTSSSNLLDFTSPTFSGDDSRIPPPALLPTVQPGRRGRPNRESSRNQLPADKIQPPTMSQLPTKPQFVVKPEAPAWSPPSVMPQLPAMPQPSTEPPSPAMSQPPKMPQARMIATEQSSSTAKFRSTATPRLLIPGSQGSRQQPSAPAQSQKFDAFGMPSMPPAPSTVIEGFGDSFGVRASKFGSTLQRPSLEIGYSNRKASRSSNSSPRRNIVSPESASKQSATSFDAPRTISPAPHPKRTPDPSSSIPDGEINFETRFPSIESIPTEDSSSSPPPPRDPSTSSLPSDPPRDLISPITSRSNSRPSGVRQTSMIGSLTGGEPLKARQVLSGANKPSGAPQPHSTHVTGTAFTAKRDGILSPSTLESNAGYFDAVGAKLGEAASLAAVQSPMPQDLLTGEESGELLMPSMRPAISSAPSTRGSRLMPPAPSQTMASPSPAVPAAASASTRPLLPQMNSSRPDVSLTLKETSSSHLRFEKESQREEQEESSDEEAGPEDASSVNRRPVSPARRDSTSNVATLPHSTQRSSAFEATRDKPDILPVRLRVKSATTSLPIDESGPRPAPHRLLTNERIRPQSMYVSSPSASTRALLSASPANASPPLRSTPERPSHSRKGSTTDMVTRFESLRSPVNPASVELNATLNGAAKKPSVAVKPAALRKSSSVMTASSILPQKPTSPPRVAPNPADHSQTVESDQSLRSSSRRSVPATKSSPTTKPDISVSPTSVGLDGFDTTDTVHSNQQHALARESPEKQQSVNLLIQRWNNQGGLEKSAQSRSRRVP
ncbi:MAG: hypothetical protein TREMPRED_003677 [Tremellales sp. Tagirdzhanova-0007]|nr:MAG: hypothetical protein TREMPRED_003677 [Tremellales sp. Tagirdzhanova-0007]